MMYKTIYTIAALLTFLFSGCEKHFNLDKYRNPEIEKMLVVNSILCPDSVIGVSVTRPYFFSSSHMSFASVKSLDVSVSRAGIERETLVYDECSGLYISGHRPSEGEILKLEIRDGSDIVVSCDTIPYKVEIEKVEATVEGPMHIYWDNDYLFTYQITFQDPSQEDNYYFLAIEDNPIIDTFQVMGQVDYTADYVFQVLANMINRYIQGWKPEGVLGYPFCDKGIDGMRYTLTVNEILQSPWVERIDKMPRKVALYSISKAYFEYMVSVLSMDYDESALQGSLLSLGLLEPERIFSNIKGGAGLMGSYNLSVRDVDLLELAGGWPERR